MSRLAGLAVAAALVIAGCGGEDEPTETTSPAADEAGPTGATGATGAAGPRAETEGPPIEEIVAAAAGVEAEEVRCGTEELEAAIGGGGTCAAAGAEYVVADPGEKLELDSLTVKLRELRTARTVRGNYEDPRRSRNGRFVIGTLAVTNTGERTELFDDFGKQVRLGAGGDVYSERFDVLNGVATKSFLWEANKIKSGDTQIGEVVFDVPRRAAAAIEDDASIHVLNFADQRNPRRADQVGLLRTAG